MILLTVTFEFFAKVSVAENNINPLYCVCLPRYTWGCGMKYTFIRLQTLQDKHLIPLFKSNITGVIGSVLADRYVKSDDDKGKSYIKIQPFLMLRY